MSNKLSVNHLATATLDTDQPEECVQMHSPTWLPGTSFWTVQRSLRHWAMVHDTYTASFVLGPSPGMRATWQSRGVERMVAPGCLQLMNPGEAHRTTMVSEPASFFVLWWSSEVMDQAARELGAFGQVNLKHAQLDRSSAAHPFAKLNEAVSSGTDALEIEHWYVEATRQVLKNAAERTPLRPKHGLHHPNVRRAIEYVREHFADAVTLDELAREAGLSKFHLARCFRDATGHAPHQYLKLMRLQTARRLLESGVSVNDAARQAGFADPPHLARAFRVWLGVPPSQWARASRIAFSA
jgi:AraC-like DNA-binding protein